jgi:hypothetical protein
LIVCLTPRPKWSNRPNAPSSSTRPESCNLPTRFSKTGKPDYFPTLHKILKICSITFFTNLIYTAIRYTVSNGNVSPFVGHNAILRWSAVQEVAYRTRTDMRRFGQNHMSPRTLACHFDYSVQAIPSVLAATQEMASRKVFR